MAALAAVLVASSAMAELAIYPSELDLSSARDRQRIVVVKTNDSGETVDVTADVTVEFDADNPAAAYEEGRISPVRDGDCQLLVRHEGQEATAQVRVRNAVADAPLSLRQDVMPVLMRAGCNAGRCHGAARGQDGFGLSLFGFDADTDHFRLLHEISGRRVNLGHPEASLILTKAIGQAPHGGGVRFEKDSDSYRTLLRWINEGAANDDAASVVLPVGIDVYPPRMVLVGPGKQQQMTVVARYSDGTTRDVTSLALYLSNNDNSAAIADGGRVESGAPGEAFLMARFATFTEGAPIVVLSNDPGPDFIEPPAFNEIDEAVYAKLRRMRITPSPLCNDEAFLRRASIDLTGLTPTRERWEAFRNNPSPTKRVELIDELLASEHFVDVWTMRLGELLKIRSSNQVSYKALVGFHNWLRDQVQANRPLDDILSAVLESKGGTFTSPATNYYQIEANTLQLAENVAQTYLGMRIQCARCHNHPFDRWTMDDYYGFAAFFSQVGFKQSHDPREFIVYNRGQGEVRHFVDQRPVMPKHLGGDAANTADSDRRVALAEWLTDDGKEMFARNLANIIWAHHFGRGVIEPVDDVRVSNPPSNPELLDALAESLIAADYDLRTLVRQICLSRTYQLSTKTNETNADDVSNFSRAQVRRMRAEALLDSISQITGTTDRYPRLPVGARAAQIADGAVSNYFLTTFGRAPRETVCACEVDVQPNLSQALHLINGDATNDKIADGGRVGQLLERGATPEEVITELFIACYARAPSPGELERLRDGLPADDVQGGLHDLFWALLNSKEFMFNH